jgi:hypothetical protein
METNGRWVIVKNNNGDMELKPFENSKDLEVIEEFEKFSEAKEAFNFYLYILLPKFGQNMNF